MPSEAKIEKAQDDQLIALLGRRPAVDARDKNFPMKAMIVKKEAKDRTYRYWNQDGYWADQGFDPHCVGFAWTHWLEDGPITHPGKVPIVTGSVLYREAQKLDEWEGEDYDGTSVRGGAKALRARNLVGSFYWAFDAQTVADYILSTGPVVVGTNWYHSMFYPNSKAHIEVSDTDGVAGGHAYVLNGYNKKSKLFRIKNSWGRGWGKKGNVWIPLAAMDRLIKEAGEACIAVETKLVTQP